MQNLASLTAQSRLEHLPLDLLTLICDHVADLDGTKSNLFAFSMTSKTCCSATTPLRFRDVHIDVKGPSQLRRVAERWMTMLQSDGRASFVRVLRISGRMALNCEEEYDIGQKGFMTDSNDMKEDEEDEGIGDYDRSQPENYELVGPASWSQFLDGERQKLHKAWLPLGRLIAQLFNLRNTVYTCSSSMSPYVLKSLQTHCPANHLHFHFDDLRMKSRSLYNLVRNRFPETEFNTYHTDGVLCLARGLPRLTNVRMLMQQPGGFFPMRPLQSEPCTGHLQNLVFFDRILRQSRLVKGWAEGTGFENLCRLDIRSDIGREWLQTLADVAENGQFPSLCSLTLCGKDSQIEGRSPSVNPNDPYDLRDQVLVDQLVGNILQHLNPLDELILCGNYANVTFAKILSHHGNTLRKLSFVPIPAWKITELVDGNRRYCRKKFIVSHHRVEELVQQCQKLENLKIVIPRSQGDPKEVAIYRALGTLPYLNRLTLFLDCSVAHMPSSQFRDLLHNAAVDASLAKAIYRVINDKGPLERLWLKVQGAHDTDNEYMLKWVARNWVVSKSTSGNIVAKEMKVKENFKALRQMMLVSGDHGKQNWERYWSSTTSQWWDEWSSVPLAEV